MYFKKRLGTAVEQYAPWFLDIKQNISKYRVKIKIVVVRDSSHVILYRM